MRNKLNRLLLKQEWNYVLLDLNAEVMIESHHWVEHAARNTYDSCFGNCGLRAKLHIHMLMCTYTRQ